jgi:hypothetical protein
MEDLSNKAKIVYASLDMLGAKGKENRVTSYGILDFISENEDLANHDLLKDIDEQTFVDIIMEINLKSVNTLIASLCRKGLVEKTEPSSIVVDGERRSLRQYFLK